MVSPQMCSDHGHDAGNLCDCDIFWGGSTCSMPFTSTIPAVQWGVAVYASIAAHAVVAVFAFLCLAHKWRACASCRGTNARDVVMGATCVASALRVAFLVDPGGMRGIYSPAVSSVLSRVPQIMWVACFMVVTQIWSDIFATVRGSYFRARCMKRLHAVLIVLLTLVCGTFTAFEVVGVYQKYGFIACEASFAACGAALLLYGLYYARESRALLIQLQRSSVNAHQRTVFTNAFQVITRTLVYSGIVVVFLVIGFVAMVVTGFSPFVSKWHVELFYAYFILLHLFVEGGCGGVLLFANFQSTHRWWDRCIKPSSSSSSSSSGTGPHHAKQGGAAREAYDSVMAHHDSPNWGGATGREADEAMPLTSDASQTGLRMSSSGYERGDDGGHGGAIASQHSP